MRFLSFHCEYFNYKTTKKSRSKILEDLTDDNKEGGLINTLVLFISIEKQDEINQGFLENGIIEIENIINQLNVKNIIILSFAHLFGSLSDPKFGFESLKNLEKKLLEKKYTVLRPPFGWFNELELKAKGHPLSRMSRMIN